MKNYAIIAVVLAVAGYVGWGQLVQEAPEPVVASAAFLVEVNVPELAGNAIIGKQVFDAKCAACHGDNAAGLDGSGPPLIHKIYEPSHHGDQAFLLAVRRGVRSHHWRFGDMPPVEGLTDGDVKMIVEYIRAVQRNNGIS